MLLKLDFSGVSPIYRQIRDQVVLGIAGGWLRPGDRLPTVRALAEESGVNMMTVSKAYGLLRQEGYIRTDRRGGTVILSRAGERVPGRETVDGLRLRLGELKLAGLDREAILKLCGELLDGEAEP